MSNPDVFDYQFRFRMPGKGWSMWLRRETAEARDGEVRHWLRYGATHCETRDLLVVNAAQVSDQLDLFPGMVANG